MAPTTRRMAKESARKARQNAGHLSKSKPQKPLPYLPQEIKDQIFGHTMSKSYDIITDRKLPAGTTQALLLISKDTHDETLRIVYSNSLFRYSTYLYDQRAPMQALTDRMMHVEVVVDCQRSQKTYLIEEESHSDRTKYIVERFGGTDVKRDTFVYYLRHCSSRIERMTPWPYLQALENLIRFKIVRVEYNWIESKFDIINTPALEEAIKEDLEPALGPATVRSTTPTEFFPRYLEFRPREYLATNPTKPISRTLSKRQTDNEFFRTFILRLATQNFE